MGESVLHFDGVTKVFRTKRGAQDVLAVDDVSFALQEGQTLSLVGESGSGKTTIGRLITGIDTPTSGQIRYDSHRVEDGTTRSAHKVQMVFQDPYAALNPFNSVQYTLTRPLINHLKLSRSSALRRATELLETVHLTPPSDYLPKRPDELSGGQRQRVVIARALAPQPDIIVADEPVSMLDVSIRADIITLLDDLRKQKRVRGLLYITHDLLSARFLADEVLVLFRGKNVEYGKTRMILGNPLHPYTRLLWDAMPNPRRTEDRQIAGADNASSNNDSTGCPFVTRCPMAIAICRTVNPPLKPQADGRRVACHVINGQT